jgi:hypothetical protein
MPMLQKSQKTRTDSAFLQPIDRDACSKLLCWIRVQPRFALVPVLVGRPVAAELLNRRQLNALRPIGDEFLGGPAHRDDAPPKAGDFFVEPVDPEGTDCGSGPGGLRAGCWC